MARRLGTALAAVAASAAAGCGGGDGGSAAALTHAELVARADGVCARLARRNAALEPPFRPYSVESERFFARFAEHVSAARESLEELDAPAEDEQALDRLVEGYEAVENKLTQLQTAVSVDQDEEAATLIAELQPDVDAVVAAERELGACAGERSARETIAASIRRLRKNPLEETGKLG